MPIQDWTKVEAGIFHAFHHEWISELYRILNRGLLPPSYYALPEQIAAEFWPDVLTLQRRGADDSEQASEESTAGTATAVRTRPRARFMAETESGFYRRKKSSVVVRHVSDDRVVAIIEIVSPGNKSSQHAFEAFVDKACDLLEKRVHLLIIDPFPPGARDPNGIHAAIWEQFEGSAFELPAGQPLTLVAYECDVITRAYIEPAAAGQNLPDMPLFLRPNGCVMVPLQATYDSAYDTLPRRWRDVLEAPV
jgi:hypothetical protein